MKKYIYIITTINTLWLNIEFENSVNVKGNGVLHFRLFIESVYPPLTTIVNLHDRKVLSAVSSNPLQGVTWLNGDDPIRRKG